MTASNLEEITRTVVRTVHERLGRVEGDVLEVVVREVVEALCADGGVPRPSTAPPPGDSGAQLAAALAAGASAHAHAPAPAGTGAAVGGGATDNGDGTMTTPLGAVLPIPPAGRSLEICSSCVEQQRHAQAHSRAVITTTGQNRKGVVATVAARVAEAGGDIQDISQTIVSDYFTMIMVVDIDGLAVPFSVFRDSLLQAAGELGIHAVVMHEDVMRSLQRV